MRLIFPFTVMPWDMVSAGCRVSSRALLGQCLDAWGCSTNSACHLPALHFQGDSSFVVMTNFIVTPQQAQGYCAEVRTPPLSWTHRGDNMMESLGPW